MLHEGGPLGPGSGGPGTAQGKGLLAQGAGDLHAPVRLAAPCKSPELDAAENIEFDTSAAISGDQDALRRVWHENRRWVAAIILAHKPRWADVEDLLQEVALALVRKVSEVRDPRALKPWLRTVAMNAAHAAARSGRRRARDQALNDGELEQPFVGRSTPPPDEQVGGREDARRLMDLAARLPDGYREPLLLKAIHNLSYREIGEILGLPETTVETRIARGRRQLRELASERISDGAGE